MCALCVYVCGATCSCTERQVQGRVYTELACRGLRETQGKIIVRSPPARCKEPRRDEKEIRDQACTSCRFAIQEFANKSYIMFCCRSFPVI